jgi:hypothetical protein
MCQLSDMQVRGALELMQQRWLSDCGAKGKRRPAEMIAGAALVFPWPDTEIPAEKN